MTSNVISPESSPLGMQDPALVAYYSDRGLVRRNILVTQLNVLAHSVGLGLSATLSNLHMRSCGIGEDRIAFLNSLNLWIVSYLVMYFSWRSDHTVSRWGRRTPYVLISLPFVCIATGMFPFFTNHWSLFLLYGVKMFFLDMMLSTQPLLRIDCVPRHLLGRVGALTMFVGGASSFVVVRYGMRIAESHPALPFVVGAALMAVLTATGCLLVREPPIRNPATRPFRPWSALAIGCRNPRVLVLMLGVSLIGGFYAMFAYWNPFWATSHLAGGLNLDKSTYGDAISWQALVAMALAFPLGWIVDRYSGYVLSAFYYGMQVLGFIAVVCFVRDPASLTVAAMICAAGGGLSSAADLLVYRTCDPREVGSVTSSLSLIRNLCSGCLIAVSGVVVSSGMGGGVGYRNGFVLGLAMATIGLALIAFHGWSRSRAPAAAAPAS